MSDDRKTPGQAAYEAEFVFHHPTAVEAAKQLSECWNALDPKVRAHWEGLAGAVFNAVAASVVASEGTCPACVKRELDRAGQKGWSLTARIEDFERRVIALEEKARQASSR